MYWLFWRGRLSLPHGFIFATGLLIIGVKVFSVQYLLWLSPLIAYAYGTQALALVGWGIGVPGDDALLPGSDQSLGGRESRDMASEAHTPFADRRAQPLLVVGWRAGAARRAAVAAWS